MAQEREDYLYGVYSGNTSEERWKTPGDLSLSYALLRNRLHAAAKPRIDDILSALLARAGESSLVDRIQSRIRPFSQAFYFAGYWFEGTYGASYQKVPRDMFSHVISRADVSMKCLSIPFGQGPNNESLYVGYRMTMLGDEDGLRRIDLEWPHTDEMQRIFSLLTLGQDSALGAFLSRMNQSRGTANYGIIDPAQRITVVMQPPQNENPVIYATSGVTKQGEVLLQFNPEIDKFQLTYNHQGWLYQDPNPVPIDFAASLTGDLIGLVPIPQPG